MSILESFYILFKGDSSDVKKAAKESDAAVQSLRVSITDKLKQVDGVVQHTSSSFTELGKAAIAFFSASAAAYTVFNKTIAAANYAADLGNVAKALNVNVTELDAWDQAVQRTGGNAAAFNASLRSIAQHFGTSAGVALKFLPQLADAFQRLGNFRAQRYGRMLGLDESTILLLQQGRREIESVITREKEIGLITQKNVELATRYKIANLELSLAFRSVYLELSQTILPVLTDFYKKLTISVEYLRDHKDFVIGAFYAIGAAATVMVAPFIIAQAPLILIGAAIAGLITLFALAYEDIKMYVEGNDSLTGHLIERWKNVKNILVDVFKGIREALELAFYPLYLAVKGVGALKSVLQSGVDYEISARNQRALLDTATLPSLIAPSLLTSQAFNRNNQINVGDVTINTQAVDGGSIKDAFMDTLMKHTWQANNQAADGMAY